MNIHRLRKGEAGVSLIVPLTEIRPSRVISLPVSFAFDPRPMRFDFHSLRKGEREREKEKQEEGEKKRKGENRFFALSCPIRTRNSNPRDIVPVAEIHRDTDLNIHTWV